MRTRPRPIHLAAAACAALLALGTLTACGGDDGGDMPKKGGGGAKGAAGAFLEDVQKATMAKESVQVSGSSKIGDAAPSTQFQSRMSWAGGNNLFETTMGTMKSVTTKDGTYLNMKSPLAPGKTWMKMGMSGLAERDVTGKFIADVVSTSNPAKSVALLLQAGDLKDVGAEDRGGVHTRHFAGTVEFGRLVADVDTNLTAEDIEALREQQASLGVTTEKLDLWIGPDKLVTHAENLTQSNQGPLTFQGDYTNWGAKFDIALPPADQVYDMGDLTKGLPNMPGMPSMPGRPSMPGMPSMPSHA